MQTSTSSSTDHRLLDILPEAIVVVDAQWRFQYANAGAQALFQMPAAGLLGQVCWELFPAALGSQSEAELRRAMAERTTVTFDSPNTPAGLQFSVQAFPYNDGLGVQLRDVSEDRQVLRRQMALGEVATQLVGAVQLDEVAQTVVGLGTQVVGAAGGVLCALNAAGTHLRVFGAAGFATRDVREWEQFALDRAVPLAQAARTGQPVFHDLRDGAGPFHDLPEYAGAGALAALPLAVHGRTLGVLGFSFDADHPFDAGERAFLQGLADQAALALERARLLLEREADLARVAAEHERLSAVLDQLPVAVWLAEVPSGKLVAGNRAIERILRLPYIAVEDVDGYEAYVGYRPDGRRYAPHEWPLPRVMATGAAIDSELIDMERPDGSRVSVHFTSALIHNAAGEPEYAVVVGQDVSERRRAELMLKAWSSELERQVRDQTAELQAANAELEAFSYSVSHDLRAPLRHVRGFVDLLSRSAAPKLSATEGRYLGTIAGAATRMGVLIDELLAFSRTARQPLSLRAVPLAELVDEVRQELRQEQAGRSIRWEVGPLPSVQADRLLLRLALTNLLSNAIKYSAGRDPAVIEVGAREEGAETQVWVRDNGAGFDPQYAGKLFGVFQRLHRDDEFEGVGIGLANVQRIVARHGGRVWAEGALGQGATFWFSLPNEPARPADETPG